jgi:hypothetical protein
LQDTSGLGCSGKRRRRGPRQPRKAGPWRQDRDCGGLPLLPDDLAALGKRLRTACGAGGTCKEGVLEVQGDHAERVVVWLNAQGHKAKRSGG